jgi:hypothetical protein
MLSCICLEPEDEERELPLQDHGSPLQSLPAARLQEQAGAIGTRTDNSSPQTGSKERKKLRDKVVIYTGALGSRDTCDESAHYDQSDCSDDDGFEYQADNLFDTGDMMSHNFAHDHASNMY